jgi:anti-sigma factor RsiW
MSIQITEHDEFLLSQLLDDQLTAAEAETLRARMTREPALRAAYEEFVALDRVLQQRAGDQPAVSSEAFCESVANRIEQEHASPAVIRFPLARLMAFGLPMAAAAAIALVVFLPMGTDQSSPVMPEPPTDTEPDVRKAMVQIHKPAEVGDSGSSPVRVSFLR